MNGRNRQISVNDVAVKSAEINRERPDEHQRNIEGAADPGAVVETNSQVAFKISKAQRDHAASESDDTCPGDDA